MKVVVLVGESDFSAEFSHEDERLELYKVIWLQNND